MIYNFKAAKIMLTSNIYAFILSTPNLLSISNRQLTNYVPANFKYRQMNI